MKNKISANVILLGIVSFLNDLSSEMIMPILPMFIKSLGGTAVAVGLIGGLRDSISSVLKVFSGFWSDRTGKRKMFVCWGYLFSSIFKLLLAFSRGWQQILVFSGLERMGKGLRTAPRDAILADSMPGERGRGFGIHRALDTSGALLGSCAVFLLFWFLGFGFKAIILIASVVAFISLVPLYFVKERQRKPQGTALKINLKNLSRPLKLFILVSSLFALANFSYMFFILKAQGSFSGRLSVGIPILLYILFNFSYASLSLPFGLLSDRVGRKKVIILGYLLFSLVCLGFAFFNSLVSFIILFFFYGTVQAIIDANQRAYVSDLSQERLRATALGAFHTITGLIALPGSLIAGFFWQNVSQAATFIFAGVVSLFALILFATFEKSP
jgi:MFS family permease